MGAVLAFIFVNVLFSYANFAAFAEASQSHCLLHSLVSDQPSGPGTQSSLGKLKNDLCFKLFLYTLHYPCLCRAETVASKDVRRKITDSNHQGQIN